MITVEEVFEPDAETPLGLVARVSSQYENNTAGFLPYQGEFVKDERDRTAIYRTKDKAHAGAVAYATRKLKAR